MHRCRCPWLGGSDHVARERKANRSQRKRGNPVACGRRGKKPVQEPPPGDREHVPSHHAIGEGPRQQVMREPLHHVDPGRLPPHISRDAGR